MDEKLYNGGWNTSNKHKKTILTGHELEKTKMFYITSTELSDGKTLTFSVKTENKSFLQQIHEGGNALIEAKYIEITQIGEEPIDLNMQRGSWSIINNEDDDIVSYSAQWSVFPNEPVLSQIASFEKERECVLSLGTFPGKWRDCIVTFYVDNKKIKDINGNDMKFIPGSSIIVKGKEFYVEATGHSESGFFSGSISINKDSI